ncbi:MAG: class I SAM-dependent DNA methyltransferase, partial [Rhodospirillales bacterium]
MATSRSPPGVGHAPPRAISEIPPTPWTLTPPCGTGNFLYVTLEHLKRLEAEVWLALEELGERAAGRLDLAGETVGPHQMLGIEKNPRAVPIAEVVLWIGHLQWHLRHRGVESLGEPILKPVHTIRLADAVLAWGREEPVLGPDGRPASRWDGHSMRTDPATGRRVPDETARTEVMRYRDPRPADPWPEADFIVGNPPFVAGKDLRQDLGDGYAEAFWTAYPHLPGGADFVMAWWDRAAELVRAGTVRRFGLITTNSITQVFCRRVIQRHLNATPPLTLAFAVADHPWADGAGTAAVRIAMTVGTAEERDGVLKTVTREGEADGTDGSVPVTLDATEGRIGADLTIGPDVVGAKELAANRRLCSPGVKLHGAGFIVSPVEARALGLGTVPGLEAHIRPYRNGRDLTGRSRDTMVIDLFGLTEAEVRQRFPAVWQHVFDRVKPERDANNREAYRTNWWIFGEPRRDLRPALAGLPRYIATVETAKHRVFQFLDAAILPDNKIVAIAMADAWTLGVLSSQVHRVWYLANSGRIGVYDQEAVYVKSRCFDPFPFPILTPAQAADIGALAEEIDAHRKRVLADHPGTLTLTGLYNALAARREGREQTAAEKEADRLGSVGKIKHLHDMIDAAVAAAYGWPATLEDRDVLARLVALNAERAREEAEGHVRWLRPEYQNPDGRRGAGQISAVLEREEATAVRKWPPRLPDQMAVLPAALARAGRAMTPAEVARGFRGARAPRVRELLAGLAAVGQVRRLEGDRRAARGGREQTSRPRPEGSRHPTRPRSAIRRAPSTRPRRAAIRRPLAASSGQMTGADAPPSTSRSRTASTAGVCS